MAYYSLKIKHQSKAELCNPAGLEKAFKYKRGKRNYFFAEVSNRKNIQSTNK